MSGSTTPPQPPQSEVATLRADMNTVHKHIYTDIIALEQAVAKSPVRLVHWLMVLLGAVAGNALTLAHTAMNLF